MERVAELVRLGRLVALAAAAAAVDPVATERVALEPREQVVQDLLADLPAAARGQLHVLAVAGQVAGLLEPAGEVVQGLELAQGVVAEQVADLVAIDGGEVGRRRDVGQRVLQPVHRLEPADLREGTVQPQRLLATERDTVTEPAGQEQVEVRRELGEVDEDAVVAERGPPSSSSARPAAPGSSTA